MRMLECAGKAWFVSSMPFRDRSSGTDRRLLFYCVATRERLETTVVWPSPIENAPDGVLRAALDHARRNTSSA